MELSHITITMISGKELIKDLSITIQSKDKLAIIGEEGNGKSTLLKCIYDIKSVESYVKVDGKIQKENLKIGYLEQFLNNYWKCQSVEEFFLKQFPQDEIDYEGYATLYRVEEYFKKFQIDSQYLSMNKKIETLSGGEKIKIQLIKIMLQEPDLLLLDEPTNDIDIDTLEWLEEFLCEIEIPIIFISHDEVLLSRVANCILHLEQRENKTKPEWTYEHIPYEEYVEKRIYHIQRQNQIATNEKRTYDKQMEKFRKIYQKVEHEQANISRQNPSGGRLLKKKMHAVKALERRIEKQELTARVNVEESIFAKFHNEDALYRDKIILDFSLDCLKIGDKELSQKIFLKVVGKDKVVIIGNNGTGKTTLLKKILEQLQSRTDISVGYMPQDYEEAIESYKTPVEFLKKEYTKEEETLARTYLGSMKFTVEEMTNTITNLSGGQKAKLWLVKLMMDKNTVLLLDEPTRNLSPLSTPVIRALLKEFKGAIISISHDRKYIYEVCNQVYELTPNGLNWLMDITKK